MCCLLGGLGDFHYTILHPRGADSDIFSAPIFEYSLGCRFGSTAGNWGRRNPAAPPANGRVSRSRRCNRRARCHDRCYCVIAADLWETVVPAALLFPILVWLAVRCQPVFA